MLDEQKRKVSMSSIKFEYVCTLNGGGIGIWW